MYDTLCREHRVGVAVEPERVQRRPALTRRETVAQLAKQFSRRLIGTEGRRLGCYAPTSSSFSSVRTDVASTPLNTFPKNYQVINYNG